MPGCGGSSRHDPGTAGCRRTRYGTGQRTPPALRRQPVGGRDVGVFVQLEDVLGVEVEEVHLVLRQLPDDLLEKSHVGNRPPADVVHPAAVLQFRIIHNADTGELDTAILLGEEPHHLLQAQLCVIESHLADGADDHLVGQHLQDIALVGVGIHGKDGNTEGIHRRLTGELIMTFTQLDMLRGWRDAQFLGKGRQGKGQTEGQQGQQADRPIIHSSHISDVSP